MRDPSQTMRFSADELGLIKGLFAGNDDLLFAVRNVMYQFPVSDGDREILKGALNDKVLALLKKVFVPELDPDAPIFQLTHMGLSLGADVKTLSPEGAWPFIRAKEIEVKYLEQQLQALKDIGAGAGRGPQIVLENLIKLDASSTNADDAYVNVTAWNYLLSFIDSHIQQMKFLAGLKSESVEQTLERLQKDSSK